MEQTRTFMDENNPIFLQRLTDIISCDEQLEIAIGSLRRLCREMEGVRRTSELDHSMDTTIGDKLNQIGIPANLKGYRYMITAIKAVINDSSMLDGITKVLYPYIARTHNTTAQRVEKAVRHSIEIAWKRDSENNLKRKIENCVETKKTRPTNSEFIAALSHDIKKSL